MAILVKTCPSFLNGPLITERKVSNMPLPSRPCYRMCDCDQLRIPSAVYMHYMLSALVTGRRMRANTKDRQPY